MTTAWWAPYVGIPFLDGGRDRLGADCWGLVRLVYAQEIGIALPSYGEIGASDLLRIARTMRDGSAEDCWRAVTVPATFDVVLMRDGRGGRSVVHVGVMIDPRRLLHVEPKTDALIVPVAHTYVRGRVAGFRRYVA
ncbi:MAG: C40 family peptidase [Rhodobacteraceae bacterium]|nr:C40 family peptidase [Paracoccaceae bacterium]